MEGEEEGGREGGEEGGSEGGEDGVMGREEVCRSHLQPTQCGIASKMYKEQSGIVAMW